MFVLQVLMAAGIVSITLALIHDVHATEWIDGLAILLAGTITPTPTLSHTPTSDIYTFKYIHIFANGNQRIHSLVFDCICVV